MTHAHTAESLVAFENRVAAAFEAKQIRGPIHLCSDGQAGPLLDVFKEVQPHDWIFCTWRNHFHCLLKGMPEDELYAAILAGRSMFVCDKARRIVSSAIVGGILPIALGVAMGVHKRNIDIFRRTFPGEIKERLGKVYVFIGDMCARSGLYHEFAQYVTGHNLPVRVIVENNGVSTNAVTEETWGTARVPLNVTLYNYTRNRPHTGTGKNVIFG